MRTKAIVGLACLAAAGAAGYAATAVLGDDDRRLPPAATVEVAMHPAAAPSSAKARPLERASQKRRPKVLYFNGQGTVDIAQTGPYVDVKLTASSTKACPRVIDGGLQTDNLDVYQQGSSVGPGRGEYHVLVGFEDETTPVNFNFTSHLVCLKNVR